MWIHPCQSKVRLHLWFAPIGSFFYVSKAFWTFCQPAGGQVRTPQLWAGGADLAVGRLPQRSAGEGSCEGRRNQGGTKRDWKQNEGHCSAGAQIDWVILTYSFLLLSVCESGRVGPLEAKFTYDTTADAASMGPELCPWVPLAASSVYNLSNVKSWIYITSERTPLWLLLASLITESRQTDAGTVNESARRMSGSTRGRERRVEGVYAGSDEIKW